MKAHLQDATDLREALFNAGKTGPIERIQVSTERVTSLRGIMLDFDPPLYRTSPLLPAAPADPTEFYANVVRRWLSNHPLLNRAEVRMSGTGLHALLWFAEPVVVDSDEDRRRWRGIVKTVQAALPVDPDQPHITSVTRPVGSINGKNGRAVAPLKQGTPVAQSDVLALFQEMCDAPFKTVLQNLAGTTQVEPCPVCQEPGTKLTGLNFIGKCYGSCGNVKLAQLYALLLNPRATDLRSQQ